MKYNKFANIALGISLVIFILAVILKYYLGDLFIVRLLFSVTEAALVGGIADWFAVTALFRKPLGFPWHTAIIPSNREKVIASVVGMIENDLLSVASIKSRLEKVHIVNFIIDWAEIQGSQYFVNILGKFAQQIIDRIDPAKAARYIEKIIKDNAGKVRITPLLKKFAAWAIENGEDEKWLSILLDEMIEVVEKPATMDKIRDILEEIKDEKTKGRLMKTIGKIAEITNTVNLEDAAKALHIELLEVLNDLKNPEHPLRVRLKTMLYDITVKLDTEPSWSIAIEAWKRVIIERIKLSEPLEILMNSAIKTASHVEWITSQLSIYWNHFKQDRKMKHRVEKYIKKMVFQIIETEHNLIGNIVKETLGALTNEDLNRFIEDKAGNDLQWIRVNGSVVGSLVGLIIFLFVNLFYDPIVVPVIKSWVM